jgi:RNA polymerase sigma factor (sigma-70 family)
MDHPAQDTGIGDLVRSAAAGDSQAWAELTRRYTRLLHSIARSYGLGAADVDDAVQSTWVRLLENLDRLVEPDRVGAWLVTTARRECLRTLRKAGRERPTRDDRALDGADSGPAPDTALLREERDVVLWSAFSSLGERCQSLLRLLFADPPLSYAHISEILEMPVGAIGPTRQRCLTHLRNRITAAGPDTVALLRESEDRNVNVSEAAAKGMATRPKVDP